MTKPVSTPETKTPMSKADPATQKPEPVAPPPEVKSDHELISSHKAGDRIAFQHLVRKYENRVYNHCLRMVNDEEESADLTQEVFLKVYRNINNYEHTYSFYTWLYRITVNCCIDYMRKKRRQLTSYSLSQNLSDEPGSAGREQDIPDEKFGPEIRMQNVELSDVLTQAIGQLSEKLRSIIILKEIEGFSYEEIAEILNCSRGTVKSRLFRARERLKEILAPFMEN